MNVIFLIWGSNSEKNPHYINLAVDEENSTDDHVIVTLKHNGFGDPRLMQGYGVSALTLRDWCPQERSR